MEPHFDSHQFEGNSSRPWGSKSQLDYRDYDLSMSIHKRKQVYERRLQTPIWALDDRFLRKLLVLFIEARARVRNPNTNLDFGARRVIAERCLKERIPEWNAAIDRLQFEYVAAQHKHASKEKLRRFEIEIENLDTLVRMTQKSPIAFVAAIVILYYRLGLSSTEVGEEIGCKPPHVRVILWRLHQIWDNTFGIEFNVEAARPAVPPCRSYTRQEIKKALAAGKITIPKGDISLKPTLPPTPWAPSLPGEASTARRARLKAAGLCGNCGLNPRGAYAECSRCRTYYAARCRAYQKRKKG